MKGVKIGKYVNFIMFRKFVKYSFFGGISAAVEFVVFLLISSLFDLYIAAFLSFMMGLVCSFLLNKYIVFKNGGFSYAEAIQFIVLGLINSQVSSLVTVFMAGVVGDVFAKIISIGFIVIWNFLIMNFVIFKGKSKG